MPSVFQDLLDDEVEVIRQLGHLATYAANEQIFQEGDEADFI